MWSLGRGRCAEAAGLVFHRWEKGEEEAGEGELEVMVRTGGWWFLVVFRLFGGVGLERKIRGRKIEVGFGALRPAVRGETERRSAEGGAAVGFPATVRNRGSSGGLATRKSTFGNVSFRDYRQVRQSNVASIKGLTHGSKLKISGRTGEERRGKGGRTIACGQSGEGRWAEAAGLVFRRWEKGEEEAGEGELEVMVRAVVGGFGSCLGCLVVLECRGK
ncbi:hypothetical protein HAX54_039289 [Datura stramonium]|uniref:Uncharacterized protein n=1 Tax=Datura stramonium TaxID=4076 RepID=A0ABS8VPJ6_DATST|nr:hypothetical protein [Datura stramonium]